MRPAAILLGISLVTALAVSVPLPARPGTRPADRPILVEVPVTPDEPPARVRHGLGPFVQDDTVYYGGTVWAPDSNRWEALRGGTWTFESGVGSNNTEPTQVPKPAGYRHRAEGWYDIDETFHPERYFRRAGPGVPEVPGVSVTAGCVLHGAASMWAGVTPAEATALCYAGGQGYGNDWDMVLARTFMVTTPGAVTLQYAYAVEAEPTFDFLYVAVDTSGNGTQEDVLITQYTGAVSGSAAHTLVPGVTMRSTPGPVTLKFRVVTGQDDSDEDGFYSTGCGLALVDDITLSGAIVHSASFESGSDGWAQVVPTSGPGGAWMSLRTLSSLPPPLTFCPCSMRDSVMVFADPQNQHNGDERNIAISPWIDLKAGGDVGRSGRFIEFDGYFELPLSSHIYVQVQASWYPDICPLTGLVRQSPLTFDGYTRYFTGTPNCTGSGAPVRIDLSTVIPSGAEQVRIAIGLYGNCSQSASCSGVSNTTPWFDNIRFGVHGTANAPLITQSTTDFLQDNFATDGSLNPAAPARVDAGALGAGGGPGDTLVVRGDGGNQEVEVVFRVRPGLFTDTAALAAWAASRWSGQPALGPGWYSARLDTAEWRGVKTAGTWMGTLHESDPHFGGGTDTDRGGDGDASGLSHEIFPDHILTAGARIDYFVRARYLPPDPRNPGGTAWAVFPDTTGGRTSEMEILPSSLGPDSTWNCVLYVDQRFDRDRGGQELDELALSTALGMGGANHEGTRYDRYDGLQWERTRASAGQLRGYTTVAWTTGPSSSLLPPEDAALLTNFLSGNGGGAARNLWISGENLASNLDFSGSTTRAFLNAVCGVSYQCPAAWVAGCPAGAPLDSTFCLPLAGVAGSVFTTSPPASARGNGCPGRRSFDVLRTNAAVSTATRQLTYVKGGTPLASPYAMSVVNQVTTGAGYRVVFDAVPPSALRDPNGNAHAAARCDVTTPALQRVADVLGWFGSASGCGLAAVSAVPDGGGAGSDGPALRSALHAVTPNPVRGAVHIRYTNARAGHRVRIELVDVTGRLVRRLLDANQDGGTFDLAWDGRDDGGREVVAGLYFVTLTTADAHASRKVLVTR